MPHNTPEKRKAYNQRPERMEANRKRSIEWNKQNPGKASKKTIEWQKQNPEAYAEKMKRWRQGNPDKRRSIILKNQYGITLEEYQQMKYEQDECCAICGVHESDLKKILCVDHCHEWGKVRGLLCDTCNKGLGHFRDNPAYLALAINYLLKTSPFGMDKTLATSYSEIITSDNHN